MPVPGPTNPTTGTPPRRATTARRTVSTDIHWQPADERGVVLRLVGHARDVRGEDVVGEAGLEADVGADWTVIGLRTDPPAPAALAPLHGIPIRSGFRASAVAALPDERDTPLGQLLDDLPVAALIAGYATMREVNRSGVEFRAHGVADHMRDICSGWRAGGGLLDSLEDGGLVPLQPMVPAPDLRHPDDPGGWHDLASLEPLAMRRVRRIDVDADGNVDAMFRDTYGEPDGTETVLHEYGVLATVDLDTMAIREIEATPHVLPWDDCPAAAANVADLTHVPTPDLRAEVPARLSGIRSCTHLNDLLRSLAAVARLAALARV